MLLLRCKTRRGGRVDEGSRLLSGYPVKSRIQGSNPCLSASLRPIFSVRPTAFAHSEGYGWQASVFRAKAGARRSFNEGGLSLALPIFKFPQGLLANLGLTLV
jgi:hypothetical protein